MLSTNQNRNAAMLLLGHLLQGFRFISRQGWGKYCVFGLPDVEGVVDEEDELVYDGDTKPVRAREGCRLTWTAGQWSMV